MHTGPLLPASAEKQGKLQSSVAAPDPMGIVLLRFTNCDGKVNGGKLLLLATI